MANELYPEQKFQISRAGLRRTCDGKRQTNSCSAGPPTHGIRRFEKLRRGAQDSKLALLGVKIQTSHTRVGHTCDGK